MSIRIEWAAGRQALAALREPYRELIAGVPGATLFNSWIWISASALHLLPRGRELVAVTAWDGRRLVGCLPLTRGRESLWGIPARTLRLLGHPLSDRLVLPVADDAPEALGALLDALIDSRQSQADVAILGELPRESGVADAAQRWSGRRRSMKLRHCSRAPLLPVAPGTDSAAGGSNGLGTRLSRARKRLRKIGEIRFERHLPNAEEVPALLEAISAVEDASWKGEQGTGIFSTGPRRSFFERLSRDLAAEGMLEISLLYLDGEVASYRYGFRVGRTYLDYNFAHRRSLDALSVGRVLLDQVVSSAAESGIDLIDASRGSLTRSNILQDWTTSFIDHDELWLFGTGPWGQVMSLVARRGQPAARRLLSHVEPMRWHSAN